jgi:hypothetical protein
MAFGNGVLLLFVGFDQSVIVCTRELVLERTAAAQLWTCKTKTRDRLKKKKKNT